MIKVFLASFIAILLLIFGTILNLSEEVETTPSDSLPTVVTATEPTPTESPVQESEVPAVSPPIEVEETVGPNYTLSTTLKIPENADEEEIEIISEFQKMISEPPLELTEQEIRVSYGKYLIESEDRDLHHFSGTNPKQLNIERILSSAEYNFFNYNYHEDYHSEMSAEEWHSEEYRIADESAIEEFILEVIDIPLEYLHASERYIPEEKGYRMKVLDGLGGGNPLYIDYVWQKGDIIALHILDDNDFRLKYPEITYEKYLFIRVEGDSFKVLAGIDAVIGG